MTTKELNEKIMPMLRADHALAQSFSAALLSHDKAKVRQLFHDHAGVDLSDADIEAVLKEYGTQDQIAAWT